jgi:two-component system CheB/CheR fusion protein
MHGTPEDEHFAALLEYLRNNRGFDFTGYKHTTLMRRVQKRMQFLEIESFGDYLDYLEVHPEEFGFLFNTILINVTGFFRDISAWEYLQQEILPAVIASKKGVPIRIWSAGCASGEEAYTLAMLMAEALGLEDFRQRVKIYATDVDEEALAQARQAVYSAKDIQAVPEELRQRYFEPMGNRFIFRHDLRRSVIFGRHDLLQDAPISRLDLLVCRNTLMYFNAEAQTRVLARFHFALNDTGYLFLGKAEMLLTHANLFSPIDLRHRIFIKMSAANLRDRLLVMAQAGDEEVSKRLSRHIRLRDMGFDVMPIAQILVDIQGNLMLANQQARTMFGISVKDLGRPFQDLELSYRPIELRSLITQAYTERRLVTQANVERHLPESEVQYLNVRVMPLQDNGNVNGFIGASITFENVTPSYKLQEELQRSRQELETTNEELQSTNEELETTNEELQSTNEELETTNEELQSTNEELETMNEELQSTNEELQTINNELTQRTTELNRTNLFLRTILSSLQAAVVVIDSSFNILIWNELAEELWGLRMDEVLGRSLFSLDIGLPLDKLRSPIRECIYARGNSQEFFLDAINRRGKQIKCYVTCTPLNGADINGVILMMEDNEAVNKTIRFGNQPES